MSLTQPWTMEQLDTLRSMYAAGCTYLQIGVALNRSRGSIAGKAERLGLPKRGPAHIARVAAQNAHKRWAETPRLPKSKSKPTNYSIKSNPRERKPPMFLRVVSVPDSKPVPLMDRTGCCYPTTGEKPHLFCNEPTAKGDYCEFHFRIMYPRGKAA